jgi:hypothetical protein
MAEDLTEYLEEHGGGLLSDGDRRRERGRRQDP